MSAHALLRFGVSRLLANSAPSANAGLVAGQRVIFGSSIKGFFSSAPAAMAAAAATQAAPVPPPPPRGNPANVSARVVPESACRKSFRHCEVPGLSQANPRLLRYECVIAMTVYGSGMHVNTQSSWRTRSRRHASVPMAPPQSTLSPPPPAAVAHDLAQTRPARLLPPMLRSLPAASVRVHDHDGQQTLQLYPIAPLPPFSPSRRRRCASLVPSAGIRRGRRRIRLHTV